VVYTIILTVEYHSNFRKSGLGSGIGGLGNGLDQGSFLSLIPGLAGLGPGGFRANRIIRGGALGKRMAARRDGVFADLGCQAKSASRL